MIPEVDKNEYAYLFEGIRKTTPFKKAKIIGRQQYLLKRMREFAIASGYNSADGTINNVYVCESLLEKTVMNYFADIYRLKEFHDIGTANTIKITSYTAYWLVRNKPLQIITDSVDYAHVNEKFAVFLLLDNIFEGKKASTVKLTAQQAEELTYIQTKLLYFLKYRAYTAQNLELALECLKSGLRFFGK